MRSVIGECAIKSWESRYENRFTRPANKAKSAESKPRNSAKSYEWKPYVLAKVPGIFTGKNLVGVLYTPYPDDPPDPDAARTKRGFQPTVFWPHELCPDYYYVRETPDPVMITETRDRERRRADFRKKQGWPPSIKDETQHTPACLP